MAYTSSEVPAQIKEILKKLNILINLPSHNKLNTHNNSYIRDTSYYGALVRILNGENWSATIDYLNTVIKQSIFAAKQYPLWKDILCEHIIKLAPCISNLKDTYRRNVSCVSELEVIKLQVTREAFETAVMSLNS